jgi:VanZ family protein
MDFSEKRNTLDPEDEVKMIFIFPLANFLGYFPFSEEIWILLSGFGRDGRREVAFQAKTH